MTVPGYTDISHFRAPYKNSYLYTGVAGLGQDETPATQAFMQAVESKDGVVHWKPDVADVIITGLKGYTAVRLGDRAVQLMPLTPEQAQALADKNPLAEAMSAQTWVEQKLDAGNVVFATPGVIFPIAGATMQLAAVPKEDKETVRMTSHIAPVLAVPGLLAGLMTPAAIAGVVVVGGVAAYAIWAGFRKRGRAA